MFMKNLVHQKLTPKRDYKKNKRKDRTGSPYGPKGLFVQDLHEIRMIMKEQLKNRTVHSQL